MIDKLITDEQIIDSLCLLTVNLMFLSPSAGQFVYISCTSAFLTAPPFFARVLRRGGVTWCHPWVLIGQPATHPPTMQTSTCRVDQSGVPLGLCRELSGAKTSQSVSDCSGATRPPDSSQDFNVLTSNN